MRTFTRHALACLILLLGQHIMYAQPVDLGVASSFAVFTSAGAFSNDGTTVVTGDIGTNVGAFSGFPPGIVIGSIHVADAVSAQAATDLALAYGQLSAMTCGLVLGTTLGNGQVLAPNIYCLGAASVLNGDLILDGGCDPDAIFIFQIDGALATNPNSHVILLNSASLCNIYWQVNGAVTLGNSSVFRGNIIAAGAIHLLDGAALYGRALTTAGAIDMHTNVVDRDMTPTASILTAAGATIFCEGGSVTLNGNCGGTWNNGATSTSITVSASGSYFVTTTNSCGSSVSNVIIVTVNPLPVCSITGDLSICAGESTVLCTTAGLSGYLWSTGATINCITLNAAGTYSVTITDSNGCSSSCSQTVTVGLPPICTITGNLSICSGQSTVLCTTPGLSAYLWNTGATISCITVSTAGIYTVTVTDALGCTSVCSQTVTVGLPPICTITGNLSICLGQSTVLCTTPGLSSYLWSTGATINCITVNTAGIYTVTVTDANGCSSVCSETVTVGLPPICTITGNLSICLGQSTVLCTTPGLSSYLWSTGATINCITVNTAGIYTVTVTDANGCSSVCSETVTVGLPPICTITGNLSICLGQSTVLCTTPGLSSYLWNTGATISCITVSTAGIYTVTVTDALGCSSVCSQTVVVNPPPICTITGNLSICSGQSTVLCTTPGLSGYLWSTGATINCITVNTAGIYTVTVTDALGCSSVCSQTVVVNPPPVCTITGNLSICAGQSTVLCTTAGLSSYLWSTGATINCITVNTEGTYSVTVTDANGCSSSCSQTVIISLGNLPPVILCPENLTLECGANTLPINTGVATAFDNCGAALTVDFADATQVNGCAQDLTITRTWTATDTNGNSISCSQTITVQDNTPPIINCAVVISPIQCGQTPSFGSPTVLDACDATVNVTFLDVTIPGLCPQSYSVTRTWTATDDCGNSAQCSATIFVQDNLAPVINCPVVVSPIECGSTPSFGTPTAIDACDGSVDIIFSDITVSGSCGQGYSVTRTWTATDDCGNSAECSRTIVVQGSAALTILCPSVVSPIQCGTTPSFGVPTVTESCNGIVVVTFLDTTIPGLCPQSYSVTRVWTATDECQNSAQCSVTIVVQDNLPPVINCPVVVSPIQCGQTPSFGNPTVLDACDATVIVTFLDVTIPGLCPQSYSVIRTWTATDDCGNSAQCSATIVVQDNLAPVINCPVVVSPIQCGQTPSFGNPTVLDACDATVNVTFLDVTIPGLCPQSYSVTRTWTATDDCGNSAQCSATIVVQDNLAPVINCPVVVSPIQCGQTPSFGNPTVLDACDATVIVTFLDVTIPGLCPQSYSVIRTWTATDDCGNSAQCSATIVVQDNLAPVINCPVVVSPIQCGQTPSFGNPTVLDACDATVNVTFLDVTIPGLCPQSYSVIRTWTAIDDCGNSAQCSATIVVQDNLAPVINCPVVVSPIQCGQTPSFGDPTVLDACDATVNVTFLEVTIPGLCPQSYSVTRTWTATDDCGNSAQCSATIVVQDNTAPVITCPANLNVQCASMIPAVNTAGIVTSDNCSIPVVTLLGEVISNQTCENSFILTRTYMSTDACGNIATCAQMITVLDNIPPVIQLPPGMFNGDTMQVQCYGQDPAWDLPVFDENSIQVTDACSGTNVVTFDENLEAEGNCSVDGYINLYRLTWTVTDACGNSDVAFAFLALVDTIAPVIHDVPADTIVNCDQVPLLSTLVFATDECLCACVILFEETNSSSISGCQNGQVITRTWTATDRCGNETTAQQSITLIDTSGPQLQILQSELTGIQTGTLLEYKCSKGGIPAFFDTLSAEAILNSPGCGGFATISFDSHTIRARNCEFFGYSEQRTFNWVAVDACGNTTNLTIIVQLQDDEAPRIVGLPVMACVGDPVLNDVEAIDDCGNASLRFWETEVRNPCGEGLAVRRTYEAFDDCGNITRDTILLIPNTFSLPIISFVNGQLLSDPDDGELTVSCNAEGGQYTSFGPEDIIAENPCGVTISFEERLLSNGHCIDDGYVAQLALIWTATDVCGNHSEQQILAQVIDTTSPVFLNFKPEMSIGCNDSLPEIFTSDNCGDVVMTSINTILPGKCINEYDVRRRITVTDPCGNTVTRTQIIHVGNGGGPAIEGVVENVCDDLTIPLVTAFDGCAGVFVEVTMVQDTVPNTCHDGIVIERVWSATDACGNVTVIHQTIILHDVTPPEIQVPSYSVIDLFVDREPNQVLMSQIDIIKKLNDLDENSVFVLDDCDQHIDINFSIDTLFALNCDSLGYALRITYKWIAVDVCGNADSLSFVVDIIDDIPPVVGEVPTDTVYVCQPLPPVPNMLNEFPNQDVLITYTETMIPGSVPGEWDVTRTWVVRDSCQNVTTVVQHIIWIPESQIECTILVPDSVQCNSHGVIIGSIVTGGFGPYTYEWKIVGEKCFIQAGQGTPEIHIYVGWSEVTIILTITDVYGCVSTCTTTVNCFETFDAFATSPSNAGVDANGDNWIPTFHTIWNQEPKDQIQEITYWPNPASETMNLGFESTMDQELNITIMNLLGKVVLRDKFAVIKGYTLHPMDVSRLSNGSYLMEVRTGGEMHSKIVVILNNN